MTDAVVPSARRGVYWSTADLIAIGIFAALIRVSGLAIALIGGGMNPLTLMLRSAVVTALLVVLLHKAPRPGTLSLYVLIYGLFSLLLMGSGLMTLPGVLAAALVIDLAALPGGGYRSTWAILLAVFSFDLISRAVSLGAGYLGMRENPAMLILPAIIVAVSFLGCPPGLWLGTFCVRELRAAGILRR